MAADWRHLVDAAHEVAGGVIEVHVGRGRVHRVHVAPHSDGWELAGYVADESTLQHAGLSVVDLWTRNRTMRLAQYIVDGDSNVWVSSWAPSAGTSSTEFDAVLRHVAAEADRLEYVLTGGDVY
jgi:hypothetical protein